jgi:hypothetical protein
MGTGIGTTTSESLATVGIEPAVDVETGATVLLKQPAKNSSAKRSERALYGMCYPLQNRYRVSITYFVIISPKIYQKL